MRGLGKEEFETWLGKREFKKKLGKRGSEKSYGGKNFLLVKAEFDWNGRNFREAIIFGHLVESNIRDGKEGTNMTDG